MSYNPFQSMADLILTARHERKNVIFRRTESGIVDAFIDAEYDNEIYTFDRQGQPVDKNEDDE